MEIQGEGRLLKCMNYDPYRWKRCVPAPVDQFLNLEVFFMANIMRYDPFDDVFGDLLKGFFMRPMKFEGPSQSPLKVDVTEDDKTYKVQAEIPGVKKEDINVL